MLTLPLTAPLLHSWDAPGRINTSMRLSFGGIGPVEFGMTEAQVRAAVRGPVRSDRRMQPNETCYYLTPASGLGLMMLDARLARIDVFRGNWRTPEGLGIGSTENEVKKAYGGRVREELHPYTAPQGRYLIVRPERTRDRGLELLFETDGRVVTDFRAGKAEAVALKEGCS